MGFWREPQKTWLRRAIFQIHLWSGIAVGLYIILISLSGSAVVFRREILATLNVPRVAPTVQHMGEEDLRKAVMAAYPGYDIEQLTIPRRRLSPAEVTVIRGGVRKERRFNPFTGEDMGAQRPLSVSLVEWAVDLHDNLLLSMQTGRRVNAIGGIVVTILCLTGVTIWWRGSGTWYLGLYFNPRTGWKRINFDLHSALGFWSLAILLVWGVSGIYFGFPEPFLAVIDYFGPPELAGNAQRQGDAFVAWLVRMHFGRYGGLGVRITYVIIGLIPPAIFITGAIMWWNRVVRRWRADTPRNHPATFTPPAPTPISDSLG